MFVLEQVSDVTLNEKDWISITESQNYAMSAT